MSEAEENDKGNEIDKEDNAIDNKNIENDVSPESNKDNINNEEITKEENSKEINNNKNELNESENNSKEIKDNTIVNVQLSTQQPVTENKENNDAILVENQQENNFNNPFQENHSKIVNEISIISLVNSPKKDNKSLSPNKITDGSPEKEVKTKIIKEEAIKVHNNNGDGTLLCYLCGADFDKTEIELHVTQCMTKHDGINTENDNLSLPAIYEELFSNIKHNNKINYKQFNTQAGQLSQNFNLVSCPLCNRHFVESRIEIHYKLCLAKHDTGVSPRKVGSSKDNIPLTNNLAKSFNFKQGADSKLIFLKQLEKQTITANLICYICGVEHNLLELASHIEACEVNFANIQQTTNVEDRRHLPLKPDILNEVLKMSPDDKNIEIKIKEYNKVADANNHKDLFFEACKICGRKLLRERLEVHMRVCKKKEDDSKIIRSNISKKSTYIESANKDARDSKVTKDIKEVKEEYNSKSPLVLKKKNLLYNSHKIDNPISNGLKPGTTSNTITNTKKINTRGSDKKLDKQITSVINNKETSKNKVNFNSTMPGFNKKTTIENVSNVTKTGITSTTASTGNKGRPSVGNTNIKFNDSKFKPNNSTNTTNTANTTNTNITTSNTTNKTNLPISEPKEILFICFICNNEFMQDVFKSHVLSCFEKYNEQIKLNELKADEKKENIDGVDGVNEIDNIDKIIDLSSKCISSIPSEFQEIIMKIESGVKIDIEAITNYNEVASKLLREYIFKECKICGRKFMPDRIDLHQNSCKIPNITNNTAIKKGLTMKKNSIGGIKCEKCNTILLPGILLKDHQKTCKDIKTTKDTKDIKPESVEKKKTLLYKGGNKAKEESKESSVKVDDTNLYSKTTNVSPNKNKDINKKVSTLTKLKEENNKNKGLGKDGLAKCDVCKRTFLPDRLIVHQRSCKKNK